MTRPRPAAHTLALIAVCCAGLACASSASAQSIPVAVGSFTSEKSCTVYKLEWGRHAAAANRYAAASVSAWGSELVRDCVNNFSALRSTIVSALASSGKFTIGAAGRGAYTLTGRISDAGRDSGSMSADGVSIDRDDAVVSVEFALKDAAGRTVFGNAIVKTFPIASTIETDSVSTSDAQSGRSLYSQMQRAVALAVARAVSFRLAPMRVVNADGRRVKLNYGTPLVTLGATVLVNDSGGMNAYRLNVSSATAESALAESEAGADLSGISIGSVATFAEDDDPAANGRRFERVDLPR